MDKYTLLFLRCIHVLVYGLVYIHVYLRKPFSMLVSGLLLRSVGNVSCISGQLAHTTLVKVVY